MSQHSLRARLAEARDAELIWQWRNDPETRANSFSVAPIPWPKHREWFAGRLVDPSVRIYIVEDDLMGPVAHVRYNRRQDVAEVHLMVGPEFRGRRFGVQALRSTLPLALGELKVGRIEAVIKRTNPASRRVFERSGFVMRAPPANQPTHDDVWHLEFAKP
ncbi:MAG: GNAT family N-acetyltransferase [Gemmatimonadaceae bacterium]